ncbi:unknown [Ruminococcus sp. CAG:624]|nr:unknown [Ruminococcus sp. CAG:624]
MPLHKSNKVSQILELCNLFQIGNADSTHFAELNSVIVKAHKHFNEAVLFRNILHLGKLTVKHINSFQQSRNFCVYGLNFTVGVAFDGAYAFTLHLRYGDSHMDCWFFQSALSFKRTVVNKRDA